MAKPNIISSDLRKDIFDHRIAPGSLLKIDDLAQRFRVSSIPVREALARLVGEGLVEQTAASGFRVRRVTPQSMEDGYRTFAILLQNAVIGVVAALDLQSATEGAPNDALLVIRAAADEGDVEAISSALLAYAPSRRLTVLGTFCLDHDGAVRRIDLEIRTDHDRAI